MPHPSVGVYGHPFAETSGQAAYRKGLYNYQVTFDVSGFVVVGLFLLACVFDYSLRVCLS